MTNPGGVNFNVSPYYDDFNEDKKFVRVLFRPGRAVQARELTQLQTLFQKQIQRFGDYFFKEGAIIDGCDQLLDLKVQYVKIDPTYNSNNVNVYSFLTKDDDVEIVGASTGLTAKVSRVADLEGTDPKTLYVNYTGSGLVVLSVNAIPSTLTANSIVTQPTSNVVGTILYYDKNLLKLFISSSNNVSELDLSEGNNIIVTTGSDSANIYLEVTEENTANIDKRSSKVFEDGEILFNNIANNSLRIYAKALDTQATSYTDANGKVFTRASTATIGEGVIYISDHFVKHTEQTIILDKYSNTPSYKIGIIPEKKVVDYLEDQSLVDNATGTPNFQAPGADRFKIDTVLTKVELDFESPNSEFVTFMEVEDGTIKKRKSFALESKLADVISQRTFEESGDYTLKDPKISVREHLLQGENGGRYDVTENGNTNLLLVELEPFTAYVRGYRNEFIAKQSVEFEKGIDVKEIAQTKTQINYGNFIEVKEMMGAWDVMQLSKVDLYNTAFASLSNKTFSNTITGSVKIGEARVRSVEYVSGVPGTPTAVYRLYLYDINMTSGSFEGVRAIYAAGISPSKADVVLDSFGRAVLQESSFSSLVYKLPYDAIRRIRDEFNNIETGFTFKSAYTITVSGGTATISSGDNDETFVGTGSLSSTQKNLNYQLIVENSNVAVYSTDLSGGVSITSGSTVVTGNVGTSFTTSLNVGDLIQANGQIHRIASIANNNSLTLETPHTTGATSNTTYRKAYPPGTIIRLYGKGSGGVERDVTVQTGGTSVTIDLKETFATSFTAKFIATLARSNAREIKKILQANSSVFINPNTHPLGFAGPYSLGQADVYKIKAIYQSNDFSTNPTEANTDVTSNYILDNGQRDGTYEHGTITPINANSQTGRLKVVFDYFTHDTTQGIGYMSIDSYPIDDVNETATTINTADVPVYVSATTGTSYNLRDCIDFRPRKSANTATLNPIDTGTYQVDFRGLHIPKSLSDFDADLSVYNGRISKLYLNEKGEFGFVEGSPGFDPKEPDSVPGVLELATLTIPPYPSLPKDVVLKTQKHRRYTMKDIGEIDNRLSKLEYYTTLNQVEKQATDVNVLDETTGISKYKSGILVDTFSGHSIADVQNPDHKASISRLNKFATAPINLQEIQLTYTSNGSTNVVNTLGRKITLPYSEGIFSENPFSTFIVRVSDPGSYRYIGMMEIMPGVDDWFDTVTVANKSSIVDVNGLYDNWKVIPDAWNTEFDSAQSRWVGVPVQQKDTTASQSVPVDRSLQTNKTTPVDLTKLFAVEERTESRIIDVSVAHYMRSRDFAFKISGLKPNTRLYATLDGVAVTQFCKQIELKSGKSFDNLHTLFDANGFLQANTTIYTVKNTGAFYSDVNGEVVGVFTTPSKRFLVGDRELKLSDDAQNRDDFITTFGKITIASKGVSLISDGSHLNTRPLNNSFSPTIQKNKVNSFDPSNFPDPLSQSFYVDELTYPYGIYLTRIDLFFAFKCGANRPIYLQLRHMENGYPTKRVIGDSTVTVYSGNIQTSLNGTAATPFVFQNPIYLLPGKEYCFSVISGSNDPHAHLWYSELGQNDKITGRKIDKQGAAGVLFLPTLGNTQQIRQTQDLKYRMYAARFSTSVVGRAKMVSKSIASNRNFSAAIPNLSLLKPDKTKASIRLSAANKNGIITQSVKVDNLETINFTEEKTILNSTSENSFGIKSYALDVDLSTTNPWITPYIDLEKNNAVLIEYVINNATSNSLSGLGTYSENGNTVTGINTKFLTEVTAGQYLSFGGVFKKVKSITSNTSLTIQETFSEGGSNVSMTSKNEENPSGPYSSLARYITRRVKLPDGFDATDLNVYVDVNRPPGTNIKVYYKVLNSSDNDRFDDKFYQEMSLSGTATFTNNQNQYTQELYTVPRSIKTGGAIVLSGNVSVITGQSIVIGNSTKFTEDLKIGDTIVIDTNVASTRVVTSIANNTYLTVDSVLGSTEGSLEVAKLLSNTLVYKTPDNRTYAGYKYFAIKVVFLSDNKVLLPKIKNLKAIALS